MIDNSEENLNIISDFKVFEYKAIYDDLMNLSDKDALNHYINFGIKEKRYNSFKGIFKDLNLELLMFSIIWESRLFDIKSYISEIYMFLNKIKDKYYLNLLNKFIEKGDVNEINT